MNGNTKDELSLIVNFQSAVLQALRPVILRMSPITLEGWTNNPQELQDFLSELCPPQKEVMIPVRAELRDRLRVPLIEAFTYERCTALGYTRKQLNRLTNALYSHFHFSYLRWIEMTKNGPAPRWETDSLITGLAPSFAEATLADLVVIPSEEGMIGKISGIGPMGQKMMIAVLASYDLQVGMSL